MAWWRKLRERDHLEDIGTDGREILNQNPQEVWWRIWTGLIWLRVGTSSEVL
jgi:hypothetical protein